ncbi:hypothetical protein TELCIR_09669 [Teladorsagia circumcincta]|uniref:VWFA domain-containing protein n=1 Tax=Teladorsagia circumcincta TaxID=45464 RepID=A0A2G9UFP5_TELCI|nr:hypothetical protein TELCIR_09669 [Teladorsagia circumcincta]
MGEAGYKSTMATDMSGLQRPFTVIRGLHSFTISHDYDAGTERIHHSCENVGNDSMWAKGFPDRTCADMPRVALAFTQNGLVDVPNIARLFVVCTYGALPNVQPDDGSERCDPKATFDRINKKCKCKAGFDDLKTQKILIPRPTDQSLEEGTACLNCQKSKGMDIFFVLDYAPQDKGCARQLLVSRCPTAATLAPKQESRWAASQRQNEHAEMGLLLQATGQGQKRVCQHSHAGCSRPTGDAGNANDHKDSTKEVTGPPYRESAKHRRAWQTWCIVKCIRISLVYYQAAVRMLLLGGETGIRHDTYSFIQRTYTEINKDEMYGMTDDYWKGYSVGNKLTPGLERAYKALEDRPGKRKLLVLLLDDVPNDIEKAVETLKRLRVSLHFFNQF